MKYGDKTKLVSGYCKKYPSLPDLTLAKKIFNENKLLFATLEQTRSLVRVCRGHMGSRARKKIKDKSNFKPVTYNTNPFDLPKSYAKERNVFTFPKNNDKILFISDIHIPYQDNKSLEIALKYGKDKEINTILLGGDIMDLYNASDHEKLPGARDLNEEIELTVDFLRALKKHFPEANIYYKEGNHERRWMRFLMRCAPQIIGVHEFRLDVILKLGELGITWITNETLIKAGDLNIIHGNEMKGGSAHPAKAMFERAKKNILAGDKHRTGEYIEPDIDGQIHGGWSVGCLCELCPDYLTYNRWNHGFAYIEVYNDGTFLVENKKIINGKVC